MVQGNRIKVSIIVPIYNVPQYLRRCLDSCMNQTMQEIESIVVNDFLRPYKEYL
jgi:glycosyltransferase involved in cell wall biosynthesis